MSELCWSFFVIGESYPFPYKPVSYWTAWTVPLHLLLLALSILPLVFVFARRRSPATTRDGITLVFALVLFPIGLLTLAASVPETMRSFVVGYLLFSISTCVLALIVTLVRLQREENASPVYAVLGSLLLLGVLIALLLPSVPKAKEAARRMQCSNNLKGIMLGLLNYESASHFFLAATTPSTTNPPCSWRVVLLPYVERKDLYSRYGMTQPWDSQNNELLARESVSPYQCPSNMQPQDEQGRWYTAYATFYGKGAKMKPDRPIARSEVPNMSSTLALVEACGANIVWSEPRDLDLESVPLGMNRPGSAKHASDGFASSYHSGGVNSAFFDGSVKFLSESIDPQVLEKLIEGTKVEGTTVLD